MTGQVPMPRPCGGGCKVGEAPLMLKPRADTLEQTWQPKPAWTYECPECGWKRTEPAT